MRARYEPKLDLCRSCVGGVLALGDGFPSEMAVVGAEFLKSCECLSLARTPHA